MKVHRQALVLRLLGKNGKNEYLIQKALEFFIKIFVKYFRELIPWGLKKSPVDIFTTMIS